MTRLVAALCAMLASPIALASAQPLRSSFELPGAYVGEYYEYGVVLQGMVEPIRYEWSGAAPPGLEASGPFIRGTPTGPGSYQLVLTARDALARTEASAIASYRLRVRPRIEPLRTCTTSLPAAYFAIPYQQALCAEGGHPPYRWRIASSHDWISADADRGLVTGRPDRLEQVVVTASASDQTGAVTEPARLQVDVLPPPRHALELRPSRLPPAVLGQPYEAEISVNNTLGFVRWSVLWEQRVPGLDVDFDGRVARVRTDRADGTARFTLSVIESDRDAEGGREMGRATRSYDLATLGALQRSDAGAAPVQSSWLPRPAVFVAAWSLALAVWFWSGHVASRRRKRKSAESDDV